MKARVVYGVVYGESRNGNAEALAAGAAEVVKDLRTKYKEGALLDVYRCGSFEAPWFVIGVDVVSADEGKSRKIKELTREQERAGALIGMTVNDLESVWLIVETA